MEPVTLIGCALGIYLAIAHGRRSDARKAARLAEVQRHHAKRGDVAVPSVLGLLVLPPYNTVPDEHIEDARHGRPMPLMRWLIEHGYPELPEKAHGTSLGLANTRAIPGILRDWRDQDTP